MIGEAFIAVRADTSAFSSQVAATAAAAAGTAGTQASQSFSQKFATGANAFGKTMTRGLTIPLGLAGAGALLMANNFETSMSKIEGLVGLSSGAVDKMRSSVLALSGETAVAPRELGDALFLITSSGLRGKDALNALEFSAKAAAAGLGETKTVADVVTSAMVAYGPAVLSAEQATDVLVATVKTGKAPAEDFAAQFGKILPVASELGIGFDQVGGSLAYLTRSTGDAALAGTQLDGIVRKLLKPTEAGKQMLLDYGTSMDEVRASVRDRGLLPTLVDLRERFGENTEALGQVFEEGTAVAGVLQLTKDGGREAAGALRDTADAAGSTDKAFNVWAETGGAKAKKAFNDVQVAAVDMGTAMQPIVAKAAGALSDLATGFTSLPEGAQNLALIGGGALAALGPLTRLAGAGASVVDQFTRTDSGLRNFGSFLGGGGFAGNVAKGGLALGGFMLAAEVVGPKLTEITGSAELAYGAMGALIGGLAFPPWGAVVGGVLGGLYGAFFGVEESASAAEAAIKAFTGSLKAGDEGPFVLTLDEIKNTLDGLAEGAGPRAANIMNTLGFSMEGLTAAVNSGWVGLDAFRSQVLTAAEAAGLSDEKIGILNTTFDSFGLSLDKAREGQLAYASSGERAMIFAGTFNDSLNQINLAMAAGAGNTAVGTESYNAFSNALSTTNETLSRAFTEQVAFTGSTDAATVAIGGQIGALVETFNQLSGGNIPMTAQYIGTLFGIPADRFTNVTNTADIAAIIAEGYRTGALDPLTGRWVSTVDVNTGPAHAALDGIMGRLSSFAATRVTAVADVVGSFAPGGGAGGGVGFQYGGFVKAAGKHKPVAATLHGGEYVLSPDVVDRIKKGAPSRGAQVEGHAPAIPGSTGLSTNGLATEATMRDVAATNRRLVRILERAETRGTGSTWPVLTDGLRSRS